jgi:hypothetical protein
MAAYSSKDVSHIKKFDGTDFSFWKFQVELVLEQHQLLSVVKGRENCPLPDVQENELIANRDAITLWKTKDVAARSCLISTIEDSCKRSLLNCRTAAEMWTRLTVQYQQNVAESKHILCNQYYQYAFEPGNSVMAHISAIEGMAIQLTDLGVEIGATQLMTKILLTLPPSFQSFQSAWDLLPDQENTLATLTSKLVLAETMNKHFGAHTEKDQAFFNKRTGSAPPRSHGLSAKQLFCSACGYGTHSTITCRNRKRKQTTEVPPSNNSEKVDVTPSNNSEEQSSGSSEEKCSYCSWENHRVEDCSIKLKHERELAATKSRAKKSKDRSSYASRKEEDSNNLHRNNDTLAFPAYSSTLFVADSGATDHMSDQLHIFNVFTAVTPGDWKIKGIGTNSALQVHGYSTVKIRSKVNGIWYMKV